MTRSNRKRRDRRAADRAAVAGEVRAGVQLRYVTPRLEGEVGSPVALVLRGENGGTLVRRYSCSPGRLFQRIEHAGRWWRLNGQNPYTGEFVYLEEVPA